MRTANAKGAPGTQMWHAKKQADAPGAHKCRMPSDCMGPATRTSQGRTTAHAVGPGGITAAVRTIGRHESIYSPCARGAPHRANTASSTTPQ